jgi:hypothetical protein
VRLVALIVGPCLLASVGAPTAEARRGCGERSATIAASEQVRVYRQAARTYMCIGKARRPLRIDNFEGRVRHVSIAGRFVVFAELVSAGLADEGMYAAVVDTRRRQQVTLEDIYTGEIGESGTLHDLQVNSRGIAALIATVSGVDRYTGSTTRSRALKLINVPGTSGPMIVERSPELDPNSLALARNRVYWTVGQDVRSQRLP